MMRKRIVEDRDTLNLIGAANSSKVYCELERGVSIKCGGTMEMQFECTSARCFIA